MINSKFEPLTELGPVIFDIQQLLYQQPLWAVKFNYREANMVIHNFAKWACHLGTEIVWIEECSSNVMNCVLFDKTYNDIVS